MTDFPEINIIGLCSEDAIEQTVMDFILGGAKKADVKTIFWNDYTIGHGQLLEKRSFNQFLQEIERADGIIIGKDCIGRTDFLTSMSEIMLARNCLRGKYIAFLEDVDFPDRPHSCVGISLVSRYGAILPPYGLYFYNGNTLNLQDEAIVWKIQRIGKIMDELIFYAKTHPAGKVLF